MSKPNRYLANLLHAWGFRGLLLLVILLAPAVLGEEQVLVKAMSFQPASFDPVYGISSFEIELSNDLFESLMGINEVGDVVYAAAESLKVSDDGKRYHFRLRKGLRWSDGHPLTAQDFKTTVERLLDPANRVDKQSALLPHVVNLENAEAIASGRKPLSELGVDVLNEREIVFQLSQASGFFDKLAARRLYPSPTHLIDKPGQNWPHQRPQVSNGAYYLRELKPDGSGVLEQNPYYRNRDQLFFDRIRLLWGVDQIEASELIKQGLVDVA